jgi:hypothetical protein
MIHADFFSKIHQENVEKRKTFFEITYHLACKYFLIQNYRQFQKRFGVFEHFPGQFLKKKFCVDHVY